MEKSKWCPYCTRLASHSTRVDCYAKLLHSYFMVWCSETEKAKKTQAKTIKKQHSQKHRGLNVIPTHDRNCTAHCYNVKQSGRVREGQTVEIIIAYVCYLFWPKEASSTGYRLYPTLVLIYLKRFCFGPQECGTVFWSS